MKILYISTGLGLGGAEKVVTELADAMINKGHEVKIAYLTGNVEIKPQSDKVEIIYIGLESTFHLYPAFRKLKKLIHQFHPDVIHSHMVHANIFTRICRLNIHMKKLICTAHSTNEGGALRMLLYRLTNNLADLNSNVSNEATAKFIAKRAFSNHAITMYNGIDLTKFACEQKTKYHRPAKFQLISVGRLNDAKDFPNLLRGLSLLTQKSKNNFELKIVGEGSEKQNILNTIQQLQLEQHVHLLGRRDDIANLLSQSDLFILSSKYEGLPTVLIEAMACDCFVIATDCGGVKEVLGGTGILVPPGDHESLANAIHRAINLSCDEILLNNRKARAHVQNNFNINAVVDQWLKIYE